MKKQKTELFTNDEYNRIIKGLFYPNDKNEYDFINNIEHFNKLCYDLVQYENPDYFIISTHNLSITRSNKGWKISIGFTRDCRRNHDIQHIGISLVHNLYLYYIDEYKHKKISYECMVKNYKKMKDNFNKLSKEVPQYIDGQKQLKSQERIMSEIKSHLKILKDRAAKIGIDIEKESNSY